jgi:hypothetical protein
VLGLHTPVQASGPGVAAAAAGVALESIRNAGTAIARPPIARFIKVRRVFDDAAKRARDAGSPESGSEGFICYSALDNLDR